MWKFCNAIVEMLEDKFDGDMEPGLMISPVFDPRLRSLKFLAESRRDHSDADILQQVSADSSILAASHDTTGEPPVKKKAGCSKLAALMDDNNEVY